MFEHARGSVGENLQTCLQPWARRQHMRRPPASTAARGGAPSAPRVSCETVGSVLPAPYSVHSTQLLFWSWRASRTPRHAPCTGPTLKFVICNLAFIFDSDFFFGSEIRGSRQARPGYQGQFRSRPTGASLMYQSSYQCDDLATRQRIRAVARPMGRVPRAAPASWICGTWEARSRASCWLPAGAVVSHPIALV